MHDGWWISLLLDIINLVQVPWLEILQLGTSEQSGQLVCGSPGQGGGLLGRGCAAPGSWCRVEKMVWKLTDSILLIYFLKIEFMKYIDFDLNVMKRNIETVSFYCSRVIISQHFTFDWLLTRHWTLSPCDTLPLGKRAAPSAQSPSGRHSQEAPLAQTQVWGIPGQPEGGIIVNTRL